MGARTEYKFGLKMYSLQAWIDVRAGYKLRKGLPGYWSRKRLTEYNFGKTYSLNTGLGIDVGAEFKFGRS